MGNVTRPDMDKMLETADKIKELRLNVELAEIELKSGIADTIKKVKTEPEFFENGRPPAMALISDTYAFTGVDGELLEIRKRIAEHESDLEHARLLNKIQHAMVDVWRSEQANSRNAL